MRINILLLYSLYYFQTGNNTLIGSLVRLPDNYLHMAESERVLKNEEKYKELIDLYRSKKEHKKGRYTMEGGEREREREREREPRRERGGGVQEDTYM